jgi:hypothetical protein
MTCSEVASESWSSLNFLTLNESKYLATAQKIILKWILELQLVTMRSEPANDTVQRQVLVLSVLKLRVLLPINLFEKVFRKQSYTEELHDLHISTNIVRVRKQRLRRDRHVAWIGRTINAYRNLVEDVLKSSLLEDRE